MAAQLLAHNDVVALLTNTLATVAVLAVLSNLLGPISGAHFKPAISVVQALRGEMTWRHASAYAVAQVCGCCVEMLLALGMSGLTLVQASTHMRTGFAQWLSEALATGGLVLVVMRHRRSADAPWLVAAWIGAAYQAFALSTPRIHPRSIWGALSGIGPRPLAIQPLRELSEKYSANFRR